MKAFHLQRFIGPAGLALREHPLPNPRHGEVRVRLRAASLNYRDLAAAQGVFGEWVREGVIPLSDGAGEIAAVGEGVSRFRVGDRVMLTFYDQWIAGEKPNYGDPFGRGFQVDGLLTQAAIASEDALVRIPEHLSYEEAATLPCAAVTAWAALIGYGALLPGQTALVQGTGGVAIFALQLAQLFGSRVIAITSSDDKVARLKALGADAVVNYRMLPQWDQEVLRLTDGRGADLVVDVGGADTVARSVASARVGGRVSLVGLLTGAPHEGLGAAHALFGRGIQLHPIQVGSRAHFEAMNRAIGYKMLRPVIDRVFPFDRAQEAFERLASREHVGKVVVRID